MDPEKRRMYESFLSSPPQFSPSSPSAGLSQEERVRRLEAPPPTPQEIMSDRASALSKPVGAGSAGLPPSAYVDMPSGEYWGRVAKAVPGSAGQMVSDIWSAVTNPVETAGAIYDLGRGAASKAAGAIGIEQEPASKASREAMLDALVNRYVETYGGGEEGSFWKALAEDPAAIGSDIATLAGLGAPSKLGTVSKASRLTQNLDPIQAAVNAAKVVVPRAATGVSSLATGVPYGVNRFIQDAARDPARRAAVRTGLTAGDRIGDYTLPAVIAASDEMEKLASARYMSDAANAAAISRPVDLTGANVRADELIREVSPRPSGNAPPYTAADVRLAQRAYNDFINHYTHPDPAMTTIMPLDKLKRDLNALADRAESRIVKEHIGRLAGSISEANAATDPVYGKMMREWAEHKATMKDIERDLTGKTISSSAAAKRISKAFSDPYKAALLDQISQSTESGKYLKEILAGQASAPKFSDKMHGFAGVAAGVLPAFVMQHPAAAAMAIPTFAATSPRLAAEAQLLGGLVGPAAGAAQRTLMSPATNIASQLGEADREAAEERVLYGPRVQRRAGGRVDVDHAKEAQSLIAAAERAKKAHNGSTEAILHSPDEHVVKALEVANRSI